MKVVVIVGMNSLLRNLLYVTECNGSEALNSCLMNKQRFDWN